MEQRMDLFVSEPKARTRTGSCRRCGGGTSGKRIFAEKQQGRGFERSRRQETACRFQREGPPCIFGSFKKVKFMIKYAA